MLMLKILGLLITGAATTCAAPITTVHVKFVSPPHYHEHELTTDGGNTVVQKNFLSIGRPFPLFGDRLAGAFRTSRVITPENAESLWPVGVFLPPQDTNDLSSQDAHQTPDFSNGLAHPDPLLLTGEAAMIAVRYLYGHGELFFHEIPHVRAILRNQEERRLNRLQENILKSPRPASPFYSNN
ncbi:uncharacterized protein [Fopius arisanus]|uniref:Uncharacterized protein n=1 Tax=Fopius arisanus TaxID=64838 RepID=A0A9R1TTH6_9HYME|nr:PREDICTED: uncharacterized protein LOC105274147 [Fopius arisanus]